MKWSQWDSCWCLRIRLHVFTCFHLRSSMKTFYSRQIYTPLNNVYEKGDTRPFTPINKAEFMAFVGINIAMGVVSLPAIRNYWSSDKILAHPWFRTVMSRNRFMETLQYFHVVDNSTAPSSTDPDYNKLWKIQGSDRSNCMSSIMEGLWFTPMHSAFQLELISLTIYM